MSNSFEGKVAIITGASSGIGMQTAHDLAEKGAVVYMVDINDKVGNEEAQKFKDKGFNVEYRHMNITDEKEVNDVLAAIYEVHGRIDILVHSAGISKKVGIMDLSYDTWLQTININLNASFLITKAAAKYMAENNYGKIVILSSGSAVTGTGGGAHYAASKAGQIGLTRALANELATYNINVNAVGPRSIETPLLTMLYDTEEKRKGLTSKIPLGRLGTSQDIANLAVFLSSDDSSFITGQFIIIDGGRTFS